MLGRASPHGKDARQFLDLKKVAHSFSSVSIPYLCFLTSQKFPWLGPRFLDWTGLVNVC